SPAAMTDGTDEAGSGAHVEIDRACKGVGYRRPFLDMLDQCIDLLGGDAFAFHVHLDANVGKADRLLADITGSPDSRDIEVPLKFEFELVDGPAAMHRVGVKANGEAGAESGQRSLRGIGRG